MEFAAVISGFVGGCFAGFIGGSVVGWFTGWQYQSKLIEFERKINQIWGSLSSQSGVDARKENAARESAIMAQAMAILKEDAPDKQKKLMELAASNPDIALKIARKLGISF